MYVRIYIVNICLLCMHCVLERARACVFERLCSMKISSGWIVSLGWTLLLALMCSSVSCEKVLNDDEWDFIVVGAGPAGCAVAAGLAQDGCRVLVLEAGPPTAWDFGGRDQKHYFTKFGGDKEVTVHDVPGEGLGLQFNSSYWWDTVPWGAQGKGVGGSGMMNLGLSFLPSPQDFDNWPAGWKYTDLEPFYREVLEKTHVTSKMSTDGKLYLQAAGDIMNDVLMKHLGFTEAPLNTDPYNRVNVSSLSEHYVKGGQRHESCLAYLLPELTKGSNIKLHSNAEVRRILFSTLGKASGVELKNGAEMKLGQRGKLVMASGPLNTPKLLMFSGIGSQSEIKRLDRNGMVLNPRDFWIVNEAVGASIHDHTLSSIDLRVPEELRKGARLQSTTDDLQAQMDYFMSRSNFLTQFGILRLGFLAMPGRSAPDFEIAPLSTPFGSSTGACVTCSSFFLIGLSPRARDRLQIQTPDLNCDCSPHTCKTGDFCLPNIYLSDKIDREETRWALATVLRALEKEGIEVIGVQTTDDGLTDFIENNRAARLNGRHYAGTCSIGQCTSHDLKVIGTENVYVVDSSTFPTPIRAHNVITAIAVGRKAVQHVKK